MVVFISGELFISSAAIENNVNRNLNSLIIASKRKCAGFANFRRRLILKFEKLNDYYVEQ